MPVLPEIPWLNRLESWRRQVTTELIALPSTLQEFREGVTNFQRITTRLLDATDTLEQFTRLYTTGVADTRRQVEEVNRVLREQVGSPATDLVIGAVGELTDALSSMVRLNPLLRRPLPPSDEDPPPIDAED
ncbi:MAG TPA: hypothetical protein VG412_03830 [Acidimicrobiales bacterium]|nr:hypothetical protein [Acidimicrobiales bacterium]